MSDSDKQALIDGSATVQTEIVVHNENLFNGFTFSKTDNGIDFSYNIDGSISANGTATAQAVSMLSGEARNNGYLITLQPGTYTISGGTSDVTVEVTNSTGGNIARIGASGSTQFTIESEVECFVRLVIASGVTLNNVVIHQILEEGTPTTLTETNSVIDWNHEDFRLVKEEGWIGQFVARQVTGNLHNLSDDFSITDKELELKLGVRINNNTNWYSLGNFLVTKVTDDEVNDKTSFEALDYTKKFNKPYVDRMTYPCTAGDLAQDVCNQCGVILGSTTFKKSDYEITGNTFTNNESCRDVMKAIGKLALSWVRIDWDNKVYIDFDPTPFKNLFDKNNANILNGYLYNTSMVLGQNSPDRITYIPCKSNTTYIISRSVITSSFRVATYDTTPIPEQPSSNTTYAISGYIANNSGSSITITTGNNAKYLVIHYGHTGNDSNIQESLDSIVIKQQPSQYETFGNNKYYNLKTQKEVFGPVDKVVIGYSAIEGERTYIGEENGTCVINVFDNPLVFNQEQRASVIESARDLLGMTFMPLNTLTVGHPWLKGNEIVRVSDMENVSHDTIPFDRTIQYFGHIKTLINSTTETKTNDNLAYKPEMVKNFERSEIYNDQIKKEIGMIIEEQQGTNARLNQTISTLDGTIQRVSNTEEIVNDIVTTTQTSIGKNHLYIEDAKEENALSYNVDGATEQQTYSGKNLLNVTNNVKNATEAYKWLIQGDYSITQGTQYTISFDTNNNGGTVYANEELFNFQEITCNGTRRKLTVTASTTGTYSNTVIIKSKTAVSTAYNLENIQLEQGSTATEYEPYVGGTPSPNPNYPQEIKTIPSIENLCESIYINPTLNQYSTVLFIESDLKPNTTYTLSFKGTSSNRLYTNENLFSQVVFTINSGITSITVTTQSSISKTTQYEEGKGWKILKNAGGGVPSANTFENVMLEEGLVSHNYVPYGSKYARVKITGKNLLDFNKSVNGSISENSTNETLTNDNQAITSEWILCEPNTTYIISGNNRNRWQTKSIDGIITYAGNSNIITTSEDTKCFRCYYYYSDSVITPDTIKDVQIEQIRNDETESTSFESYKEREVLVDLRSENLFNKDTALIGYTTNGSTGELVANDNNFTSDFIKVEPNTDYYVTQSICVVLGYDINKTFISQIRETNSAGTFNTGNAEYIRVRDWWFASESVLNTQLNNAMLNKGTTGLSYQPYSYELCKKNDIKDSLFIDASGNCRITKNIGKVVILDSDITIRDTYTNIAFAQFPKQTNDIAYDTYWDKNTYTINTSQYKKYTSSEGWDNANWENYMSGGAVKNYYWIGFAKGTTLATMKSKLANSSLYYQLSTPETITLPNTKIPLFEGINHITFIDNLETDTSIEYYRNTALSDTYATTTQLNDVSVEKTQEIQTVRQEVITEISNTNVRIDVVNETIDETGVPIVNTGTGYTFDIEGLKIEKSDQDVKTVIDNDGLATSYQNTEILTVRSNGIEAENMTVRKFYVQKPIRMEKTKSIEDGVSVGLGFFYVGE